MLKKKVHTHIICHPPKYTTWAWLMCVFISRVERTLGVHSASGPSWVTATVMSYTITLTWPREVGTGNASFPKRWKPYLSCMYMCVCMCVGKKLSFYWEVMSSCADAEEYEVTFLLHERWSHLLRVTVYARMASCCFWPICVSFVIIHILVQQTYPLLQVFCSNKSLLNENVPNTTCN